MHCEMQYTSIFFGNNEPLDLLVKQSQINIFLSDDKCTEYILQIFIIMILLQLQVIRIVRNVKF